MVVVGAKGHALEILDILRLSGINDIAFYDQFSASSAITSVQPYRILHTNEELASYFAKDPSFVLGVGDCFARKSLAQHCINYGGLLSSVISPRAYISEMNTILGPGLNIMHDVLIQPEVRIGEGVLLNCRTIVHHESVIGKYAQICPSVTITGNVTIGECTMVGSGSLILPKVTVGNNVIVAAGSVVTKNVPDNVMVAGVPAVIKKELA